MKKKIIFSILIIVFVCSTACISTRYVDSGRVTTGKEPKFCIKTVNSTGSKVTYWGLGYKVIRYVGVSPNEPFDMNIGVKMGNWFMKYDKPQKETILISYNNKSVEVSNSSDVNTLKNILQNSKYDLYDCDGIVTHEIEIDGSRYYLKKDCKHIKKGDRDAKITEEDLNSILSIIESNS